MSPNPSITPGFTTPLKKPGPILNNSSIKQAVSWFDEMKALKLEVKEKNENIKTLHDALLEMEEMRKALETKDSLLRTMEKDRNTHRNRANTMKRLLETSAQTRRVHDDRMETLEEELEDKSRVIKKLVKLNAKLKSVKADIPVPSIPLPTKKSSPSSRQTTDAMHQYAEEYEEEIREWTNKFDSEKNRCTMLEHDANMYLTELRDSRTENLTLKEDIKKLQKVEAEKKKAEKQMNVAVEKARHMEEKIARLEREKFELEGRVQRRNQAIEMEKQARHNDYYAYKKKLADSENEKNDALNILEGIRKTMSESGAVKLAAKPSVTSSENQKPGPVHPGSKSFAKPVDANLTIVSTISITPLPSPILPDPSQLPANSELSDIVPTVRFMPFTAPNLEYAGWGSDDVQMGYRRDPIEQTGEGEVEEVENQTATTTSRPNGLRRHQSLSSRTTKSSSSNRSRPY